MREWVGLPSCARVVAPYPLTGTSDEEELRKGVDFFSLGPV